jgi:uncharacterized protein YkwD
MLRSVIGVVLASMAAAVWSGATAHAGTVAASRSAAHKSRHGRPRTRRSPRAGHRSPGRKAPPARRPQAAGAPASTGAGAPASTGAGAAAPPASVACPNGDLGPSPSNLAAIDQATICLIDQERTGRGLAALRENADLDTAAAGHTQDMVGSNYFDHTGPAGDSLLSRVIASGYMSACSGCSVGENIGIGQGERSTPRQMVAMWMSQPDHRANILDPGFREIGVGAIPAMPTEFAGPDAGPGATYTTDFGFLARAVG